MKVEMDQLVNRIAYLGIVWISLTGFVSSVRIISEPEPYSDRTENVSISCITDGPSYRDKSILSIQIMKGSEETIAVINNLQELKNGSGIKDNMKADGHVDTADATQSRLTLTIQNPTRQDAGTYTCRVFFTDESSNIVEVNVAGNVTYQASSSVRIISEPEPYSDRTENVSISCITDGPSYRDKSILSIQIMKDSEETIAVINNLQELKNGSGIKDNMKADGHVDTADATQSRLTLTIQNPTRQDTGTYTCRVFFTDESTNIVEVNVAGNVTYQDCLGEGWVFYQGDQTCLKVFANYNRSQWLSWPKAREACQMFGGDLAIIRDKAKSNFVVKMFDQTRYYHPWIGLKNHGGRWFDFKYIDGSGLGSYHPWYPGFPTGNSDRKRKCVFMHIDTSGNRGFWWDYYCTDRRPYLCST